MLFPRQTLDGHARVDVFSPPHPPRPRLGAEMKRLAGRRLGLLGGERDAFERGSRAGEISASSIIGALTFWLVPRGASVWSDFAAESNRLGN